MTAHSPPAAPITPSAPVLAPVSAIEKTTTPAAPLVPVAPMLGGELPSKMPLLPGDTQARGGKGPADRRIINTTHASIDYRIDTVGPSGVGKVEVYVTHDEGKSWRRVVEDVDRSTPADIDLPGEGLFGVRLAITNGNGFGGTPPAPAPHRRSGWRSTPRRPSSSSARPR